MKEIFIIKLELNDIPDFLHTAQSLPNDINLVQGQVVASGKSLMGIYALDISKPIKLLVRDRDNDDIVMVKFNKWIIG